MKHAAESHIEDREFKGRNEGIPLDPRPGAGPLEMASVARTAEGTTQVNVLVHDPYGLKLISPSPDLPARGPCAEAGVTRKKPAVTKDDDLNKAKENFEPGTYPRNVTFPAENVLYIDATPRMPEIAVICEVQGFAPAELFWRLKVRHVLCRHYSVGKYQYQSICLPLEVEWRGRSADPAFTLFAREPNAAVSYDADANDPRDAVMGGYGLLSVAAYPPGENLPVVAHAHLRIKGTNPSQAAARQYLSEVMKDKDERMLLMAEAAFIHESNFRQFNDAGTHQTSFRLSTKGHLPIRKAELKAHPHDKPKTDVDQPDCRIRFAWPYDPPGFPFVTFDFGVGISQFTQLRSQTVTESIAWNWNENMKAGVNILLEKLARRFGPTPNGDILLRPLGSTGPRSAGKATMAPRNTPAESARPMRQMNSRLGTRI
jgi:hypothetical protein